MFLACSRKIKSFETFQSFKSSQWSQKGKSKKKKKHEDAIANIGFMFVSEGRLKPKRSKRVALLVSINDSYYSILRKAIEKWSAYHNNCYSDSEEYVLVFDKGSKASRMPGITLRVNFVLIKVKKLHGHSLSSSKDV